MTTLGVLVGNESISSSETRENMVMPSRLYAIISTTLLLASVQRSLFATQPQPQMCLKKLWPIFQKLQPFCPNK